MGDIEGWMEEDYLVSIFNGIASIKSVKIMRDKNYWVQARILFCGIF